jgi:hypothetical protein
MIFSIFCELIIIYEFAQNSLAKLREFRAEKKHAENNYEKIRH